MQLGLFCGKYNDFTQTVSIVVGILITVVTVTIGIIAAVKSSDPGHTSFLPPWTHIALVFFLGPLEIIFGSIEIYRPRNKVVA